MRVCAAILCLLGLGGAVGAQTPGFWAVGVAPGDQGTTYGLSQDGAVAVGNAGSAGFTWTRPGGRVDFGLLPGMPIYTPAFAVSSGGSTVVGRMTNTNGTNMRAYRWTGSGLPQDLGVLSNETRSYGFGVSGDGGVVVGSCEHSTSTEAFGQAFRWTSATGMQPLGYTRPGGSFSQATGISRDAGTVVGWSVQGGPGGPTDAFTWTQAGGMVPLPHLPGGPEVAHANAVSADGAVVVGRALLPTTQRSRAVLWSGGTILDLGPVPGFVDSAAYAMSDDGNVVGGSAAAGVLVGAFVWTPATGAELLTDYLSASGVSVPANYRLESVQAISGDGSTFAGQARNLSIGTLEGYVATVPGPASTLVLLLPVAVMRRKRPAGA